MPVQFTPSQIESFWSHIEKTDGCWLWSGSIHPFGYGRFSFKDASGWRRLLSHRVAYEIADGDAPTGLEVCHTCDTPACVRNDEQGVYLLNGVEHPRWGHLFLGTQSENMADMHRKGRYVNIMTIRPSVAASGDRNGSRTHPEKIQRGERRWNAKLTEANVLDIRALAAAGVLQETLAVRFGVMPNTISRIVNRLRWKHV